MMIPDFTGEGEFSVSELVLIYIGRIIGGIALGIQSVVIPLFRK